LEGDSGGRAMPEELLLYDCGAYEKMGSAQWSVERAGWLVFKGEGKTEIFRVGEHLLFVGQVPDYSFIRGPPGAVQP
jgi:hypothetical protein